MGTPVSLFSSHRTYQRPGRTLLLSVSNAHSREGPFFPKNLKQPSKTTKKKIPQTLTWYCIKTRKNCGNSQELSSFHGHLFRRTVTDNLLHDGPDSRNPPLGGCADTFTSLVVFLGLAVNSSCLVKTLFLLDYLENSCVGSTFILLSSLVLTISPVDRRERKKVIFMHVCNKNIFITLLLA